MNYSVTRWAASTVILVLSLLLLSSVATAQDNSIGVELDTNVSGDVTFWHFWGSPARRTAIRRIVGMCEQSLPNVTIDEVFKPWGDIWTANTAAVAAGSGMPDVIVEDRPQLPQRAAGGIQQSLQPFINQEANFDTDRFWDFTWDQTLYDGESYGIPFSTDVRVLFYNKNLFRQAGLDPENPPSTWEELEAAADALDVQNENGEFERIGFSPMIGGVGWDSWALTNGHTFTQDGEVVINSPEMVEAVEWVKEWNERYGGFGEVRDFRSQFAAPPNDAFMSGQVAMITDIAGYNAILQFFRPRITLDDGTEENMEWGIALLPTNESVEPRSFTGGFSLSIPTGVENPEAAWEVVKCMTSPAAQVSWARDTSATPADSSVMDDPALTADENWSVVAEAMNYGYAGDYITNYPNWSEQLGLVAEDILFGEVSVEEGLAQAQAAVDAEIE